MNILYIARFLPYIPSSGGLTRAFHLVSAAASVGDVTILGAIDVPGSPQQSSIYDVCSHVEVLPAGPRALPGPLPALVDWVRANEGKNAIAQYAGRLIAFGRSRRHVHPDMLEAFQLTRSAEMERLTRARHFHVVVAEHSQIAWSVRSAVKNWGGPSVADIIDVRHIYEARKQELRHGSRSRVPAKDLDFIRQFEDLEKDVISSFDRSLAMSEPDSEHLRKLAPDAVIEVVPNGVDVDYFSAMREARSKRWHGSKEPVVLFTGNLTYPPNIDAIIYFSREVWPEIRKRLPGARFVAVGLGPPPLQLRSLTHGTGIELHPSVPDVRPFFAQAAAAVVPIRFGSGTRLKILEAMAAGVPVVSTSIGAEGLDVRDNHNLLLADSPADFADAVLKLLLDGPLMERVTDAGYHTVREVYDWKIIGRDFGAMLQQMADS
jgi:polysaccharide biosynthesis protein PslH